MSMAALLLGVCDHLKSDANGGIQLPEKDCEVMPTGQPPPDAGDFFAAVHPGSWRNQNDAGTCLDELFAFSVTVSARCRKVPLRRWGRDLLCREKSGTLEGGLYARAEAIRAALHGNYAPTTTRGRSIIDLQQSANDLEPEPILMGQGAEPVMRAPSWWWGTESPPDEGFPYAGLSVTLTFMPVRRVQDIASQT
jgi:hypothetical protein